MNYTKYSCLSEVMWRGKRCTVRGIQHGHRENHTAGNTYTLRFEIGMRYHDYTNVPESEITPTPDEKTNEVLQIVAEHNRLAALSIKHIRVVK